MRVFPAGEGRVQALAYSPDGRRLLVDVRGDPVRHPFEGFDVFPARELVWWDWLDGRVERTFHLRDVLYGPAGALTESDEPEEMDDQSPASAAFDVSFSLAPWRVATAWEWSNKEDGVSIYDADAERSLDLHTPSKEHIMRLALAPEGDWLAVATINDKDGSTEFAVWKSISPEETAQVADNFPQLGSWDVPGTTRGPSRTWERPPACLNPFLPLAAFAFDGRYVAAAGTERTTVIVWDSQRPFPTLTEDKLDEYGPPPEVPESEVGFVPHCLAFARGTPLLAVGGAGLVLYDPVNPRWRTFDRTGPTVTAVALTADGLELLAGTEAGTVEHWAADGGRRRAGFEWGQGPITAVAFSADGSTCAAGTAGGRVIVWDHPG